MDSTTVLLIVIGVVVGAGLAVSFLIPALKRKGVNIQEIITAINNAASKIDGSVKVIKPILSQSPTLNTIDKVLNIVKIGVNNAEQLYHLEEIDQSMRKNAATDYITSTLDAAGIKITPEISRIIDGAIEANVFALGHKK